MRAMETAVNITQEAIPAMKWITKAEQKAKNIETPIENNISE